jgi:hypothetical protein
LQQFSRQHGQTLKVAFRPARFNGDVLAVDIAGLFETLAECTQEIAECGK